MHVSERDLSTVSEPILQLATENARHVFNLIKAISFRETGIFLASETGLKIICEDCKCVQGTTYIKADIFSRYQLQEECRFKINLNILCETINLFGHNNSSAGSTMKLQYQGEGHPVRVQLEDPSMSAECSIKTQEPEEVLDFNLQGDNVISKIVMKAEALREVFGELDAGGGTEQMLEITVDPSLDKLMLSTKGSLGEIRFDFPQNSDYVERFTCQAKHRNKYLLAFLKPQAKALQLASKVSMRTDARGMLSLQYMVELQPQVVAFVEFFCVPEEVCE